MVKQIETEIEKLISYKLITSVTGIISDRAKRKYEKLGESIGDKFKNKQYVPEDSNFIGSLKWNDDAVNWSRKLTLGIEEFAQDYPKEAEILKQKIGKHRNVRRAYLEYGLKNGDIPESIYLESIKEIIKGISDEKAQDFYNIIKELNKEVKKKDKGLMRFLLPE